MTYIGKTMIIAAFVLIAHSAVAMIQCKCKLDSSILQRLSTGSIATTLGIATTLRARAILFFRLAVRMRIHDVYGPEAAAWAPFDVSLLRSRSTARSTAKASSTAVAALDEITSICH